MHNLANRMSSEGCVVKDEWWRRDSVVFYFWLRRIQKTLFLLERYMFLLERVFTFPGAPRMLGGGTWLAEGASGRAEDA